MVREEPLQTEHRLRVELRHARLGQPEHRAHFLHRELFVVVERHHDLLAFRQSPDCLGDQIDAFLRQQRAEGIDALLRRLIDVEALLAAPETEVLQAEEAHLTDPGQQLLVAVEG